MIFVKHIDAHNIQPCPKTGKSINMFHTNLPKFYESHPNHAAEDGYYPLIPSEKPEGAYRPTYTLSDIGIVQEWEAIPAPPPELTVEEVALAVAELTQMMLGGA